MGTDQFFVYIHTPSWFCRNGIIALLDPRGSRGQIASPGNIVVLESLQNVEVRNICAKVDRDDRAERSSAVMRGDAHVERFGDGSDFFRLQKSAAVNDVRLNQMRSLAGKQIQKSKPAIGVLTGGDAQRRGRDNLRHRLM